MTLTDWAALLLADCSSNNLLIFADWLELDQDDEELAQAARGVRKRLARKGGRPQVLFERTAGCYAWHKAFGRIRPGHSLEVQVFEDLRTSRAAGFIGVGTTSRLRLAPPPTSPPSSTRRRRGRGAIQNH